METFHLFRGKRGRKRKRLRKSRGEEKRERKDEERTKAERYIIVCGMKPRLDMQHILRKYLLQC